VNEDKGFYKCFGCNEAGDAITFIRSYLNFDYIDAITYICEHHGIELKYDSDGKQAPKPTKDLKALHESVAKYSTELLFSKTGSHALKYLEGRGFDRGIIEQFGLGYLPADVPMNQFLKDFPEGVLTESGIFHKYYSNWQCFFADRILFPIMSSTGQCVGFSGRTMNPEERAKYKNSPETAIFSKRRELYNLHRAREAMKADKSCYIVEGYFDVIRMVSAGYPNTVAIMGTAFTKEQVATLKRYTEEYNLLLDGDEAGQKAMRDSRNVASEAGIYPNIILLPAGEDPDTYIKKNGKEAFDKIIAQKEDLFLYTIRSARERGVDVNRKFHRLDDVKLMIKEIKDPYRKEHYIKETAQIFGVSEDTLWGDLTHKKEEVVKFVSKQNTVTSVCEMDFLSLLLNFSIETVVRLIDDLSPEHFEDENLREIFKKVVELSSESDNISVLVNDPDVGRAATDLLIRECGGEDPYAVAVMNKQRILLNYQKKEMELLALKRVELNTEDEQRRHIVQKMELLKKLKTEGYIDVKKN
jgi:DNA primase